VVEQLNLFYLAFAFFPIKETKWRKKRDVCLNALSAFAFSFWSKEAVEQNNLFELGF
jgi:hypothetical protein